MSCANAVDVTETIAAVTTTGVRLFGPDMLVRRMEGMVVIVLGGVNARTDCPVFRQDMPDPTR